MPIEINVDVASPSRHVALLSGGGRVHLAMPLRPCAPNGDTTGFEGWREDQNGVLINLDFVDAIVRRW